MLLNGRSVFALAFSVVVLGGCATQSAPKRVEDIVRERAQARWDASRKGDVEKAYALTAPSYRAVTNIQLFRNDTEGARGILSADVLGVACASEASCSAKVRFEFHRPVMPNTPKELILAPDIVVNHFDEPWVKEDGEWWLFKR